MDEHILKRLDRIADALEVKTGAKEAHVDVKSIRESPLVPVVEKIAEAVNRLAEAVEQIKLQVSVPSVWIDDKKKPMKTTVTTTDTDTTTYTLTDAEEVTQT